MTFGRSEEVALRRHVPKPSMDMVYQEVQHVSNELCDSGDSKRKTLSMSQRNSTTKKI